MQWNDPNWVADNIRAGVSIFGKTGTLQAVERLAAGSRTGDISSYDGTYEYRMSGRTAYKYDKAGNLIRSIDTTPWWNDSFVSVFYYGKYGIMLAYDDARPCRIYDENGTLLNSFNLSDDPFDNSSHKYGFNGDYIYFPRAESPYYVTITSKTGTHLAHTSAVGAQREFLNTPFDSVSIVGVETSEYGVIFTKSAPSTPVNIAGDAVYLAMVY